MFDGAAEWFVQSVGVERQEQVLTEVPDFGDFSVLHDIYPTYDAASWQVNEVRNVAQHLCVVRHHLPLDRITGEWCLGFNCVNKHSARRCMLWPFDADHWHQP